MCAPHWHSSSHGVLIQDVQSNALRVFWIPADDEPSQSASQTRQERARAFAKHAQEAIAIELRPGERHVAASEFMGEDHATALHCPGCDRMLKWQVTGIS
jgi:hypothetical protein